MRPFTFMIFFALALINSISPADAQTTLFTYQGELKDGGVGVNVSEARIIFRLWDAATGGAQIATDYIAFPVRITDGIFTTQVDFGDQAYDGSARWLEIGVDTSGGHTYTWLAPRQMLTPAPMAVHALHADTGGDNPWTINGGTIYYNGGEVGIGIATPASRLHVAGMDTDPILTSTSLTHGEDAGTAILGQVDNAAGYGVHGKTTDADGEVVGVCGETTSSNGIGTKGHAGSTTGSTTGVFGSVRSQDGIGVHGANTSTFGGVGVYGESGAASGYGGYFDGRGYFSGNVGIGILDPQAKLDVDGTVQMRGLCLNSFAEEGYVLTSDASGNGTWQAPAAGGESYWVAGLMGDIYYNDGQVGIGTNAPISPLEVVGQTEDPIISAESVLNGTLTGTAIYGELGAVEGYGVFGNAASTTGRGIGVYGQSINAGGTGVKGSNLDTSGSAKGVHGWVRSTEGIGVYGESSALTGSGIGVYGDAASPDGYGGYFTGRAYFGGNVGLDVPDPQEKLEVNGTVKMRGFTLNNQPTAGYVLTADADGHGTWQAPPAGGTSLWEQGSGNQIFYSAGNVGVGTSIPENPLDVRKATSRPVINAMSLGNSDSSGTAIRGITYAEDGIGVFGKFDRDTGIGVGVHGHSSADNGFGVKGTASTLTGEPYGVFGWVQAPEGFGVWGRNVATSGNGGGIYGQTSSPSGYAGYFDGRGYFSGNVGIGTSTPTTALDVHGTIKTTSFQFPASAQAGHVLTSDAAGNASWQAPPAGGTTYWEQGAGAGEIHYSDGNVGIGTSDPTKPLDVVGEINCSDRVTANSVKTGAFQLTTGAGYGRVLTSSSVGYASWEDPYEFSLPYEQIVDYAGNAFRVGNSTTSASTCTAIHAAISGSQNSQSSAGYFNANGSLGRAISAISTANHAIYADCNSPDHAAVYGLGDGAGGGEFTCSTNGGFGVKGLATSTGSDYNTVGGWFESDGGHGRAIYAKATGDQGKALWAVADGAEAYGLHVDAGKYGAWIESNHIGMVVKGSELSAQFHGNVEIYEYGTTNKVIELGKGLDYAEGFDITESQDEVIPPGTVLVIDPLNPGRLTRCRDAYDSKVAGIVAGANGLGSGVRLGADQFDHDVALAGRVYCNVIAEYNDITPGDLLTTSPVTGYAMKVRDYDRARGAILGKAMEPLAKGERGQILVLVTLQ